MNAEKYHEISLIIADKTNKFLTQFCENKKEFTSISKIYTHKKIHRNAIQFYAAFTAAGGTSEKFEEIMVTPICLELCMLWAYKTNQILDHKKKIWGKNTEIEASILDHDLILSLIYDLSDLLNLSHKKIISKKIEELLRDIPKGFWMERAKLNIHFSDIKIIQKSWKNSYLRRNIYLNRVYDISPLLGYFYATGKDSIFESYNNTIPDELKISHTGQILNDLSDFVPLYDGYVKIYQDQFADLRNGIITYPVHELLDEKIIQKALTNPETTDKKEWGEKIIEIIKNKGIDDTVQKIGERSFNAHIDFWNKILMKKDELLERTYGMHKSNKYFDFFEGHINK